MVCQWCPALFYITLCVYSCKVCQWSFLQTEHHPGDLMTKQNMASMHRENTQGFSLQQIYYDSVNYGMY